MLLPGSTLSWDLPNQPSGSCQTGADSVSSGWRFPKRGWPVDWSTGRIGSAFALPIDPPSALGAAPKPARDPHGQEAEPSMDRSLLAFAREPS